MKKLLSFLLGTVFLVVGLELLLAVSQWAFVRYQQAANRGLGGDPESVKVVAIGESTTAVAGDGLHHVLVPQTSYPAQLERILNARDDSRSWTVLNNGMMGGTTPAVIELLEASLVEFEPDVVIAMMGIKDSSDLLLPSSQVVPELLRPLRTVQLAAWLYEDVQLRRNQLPTQIEHADQLSQAFKVGRRRLAKYVKETTMSRWEAYQGPSRELELAIHYWYIGRNAKAEALLRETIEVWGVGRNVLARVLLTDARSDEALEVIREAIEADPEEGMYRVTLVELLAYRGQHEEADAAFEAALAEIDRFRLPELVEPHLRLVHAKALMDRGDDAGALAELDELVAPQPLSSTLDAWFPPFDTLLDGLLGELYWRQGELDRAARHLESAMDRTPSYFANMWLLGQVYRDQGRTDEEERVRQELLEDGHRLAEYFELAKLLKRQGREDQVPGLIAEAAERVPSLKQSYARLYELCEAHDVQLVVMQYPSFALELLHLYAPEQEGVVYVDNEHVFAADPDAYFFEPRFPHSFSHYTKEGAEVLAEHVADALLALE